MYIYVRNISSIASILLLFSCICYTDAYSQNIKYSNSQLDSVLNATMGVLDSNREAYEKEADSTIAVYKEYEKALYSEYLEYCNEVRDKWGDSVVVESTPKQWVEYSGDLSSRSVVDFETGKVKVEILLDNKITESDNIINSKLESAVSELLTSKGKTSNYKSKYIPQQQLYDKSIIGNQIDLSSYGLSGIEIGTESKNNKQSSTLKSRSTPVSPTFSNSAKLAKRAHNTTSATETTMAVKGEKAKAERLERERLERERLEKERLEREKAERERLLAEQLKRDKEIREQNKNSNIRKSAAEIAKQIVYSSTKKESSSSLSGTNKKVVTIELNLVEDHISARAAEYKDIIKEYSTKFAVEEPLIYGIMEQESCFNPAAKSWVPAYGLMQLVPTSGGRDAHRYVYKKDAIPSASFLYDPSNNVALGTGYLKLLRISSFAKVTDRDCQRLCMIAAYNCGAGNVSRAINGTTNLSKAIPYINAMSYDELYDKLKANLPAETKNYIYKVSNNIKKYSTK